MGRETRQARRARERREEQRRAHRSTSLSNRYSLVAGGAIVAVLLVLIAVLLFGNKSGSNAAAVNGTPVTPTLGPVTPAPAVDGIGCSVGEVPTFHEHAHLNLYARGKLVAVPPFIGFANGNDCLYWMHVHSPSEGLIHMEAPKAIAPPLKTFFDIWHKPFNSTRVGPMTVAAKEKVEVFVNNKRYFGDPRKIILRRHEDITIEVGPPFVKPPPLFNFKAQQL